MSKIFVARESGLIVNDKMRFFHGDTPARQYECGQQKGGNIIVLSVVRVPIVCMKWTTLFAADICL
jgi:hypothetical protein